MKINSFSARGIVFLMQYPVAYSGRNDGGGGQLPRAAHYCGSIFLKKYLQ